MKAFAYTEIYSRNPESDGPVTYYVLRYGLLSTFLGGISSISVTDAGRFMEILAEERAKGTDVISSRLPLFTKRGGQRTFTDDVIEPLEVTIQRTPLDEVDDLDNVD